MTDTFVMIAGLLADGTKDTGPDFGKASPFGLLVVVLLLIGTFFLVRSMNRHLRKLPESFDGKESEGDGASEADADGGSDAAPDSDGMKHEPGG
ncbi:hypothetical protein A5662_19075 [Mycobacteriaceae bacterium 1482268.1]|nr:hypothetical protein A5662_19075 [Mycobacteriaceae bacterium 1482268.1]